MNLNIGVIGAGSLGTAISRHLAENSDNVILLVRKTKICNDINQNQVNSQYYPNQILNKNIKATTQINDLKNCKIIFLTIPSSAFREVLTSLKDVIKNDTILVTTAKGIEYPSLKTMGDLIAEYFDDNYVAMSGPNFASEIMLNQPTITNISSKNNENANLVKKALSTNQFKVKIIEDIKGIELCGVLKNINAIANGICEGMNINENARYAILTKGFNDTIKILKTFGAKTETVHEYCGFGDLVLTSTSSESRNHTLGILYGQRLIIDETRSGVVFEGKKSILAVKDICDNNNISSNIVDFVYNVIIEKMPPTKAFSILWQTIE